MGENLDGSPVRAGSRHPLASFVGAVDEVGSAVPCNELGSPADHVVASGSMDAGLDGSLEEGADSRMETGASMGGLVGKGTRADVPCTVEGFGSGQEGDELGLDQSVLLE